MRLRYIISRIGINPNDIEIDEGMELARLWIEEKSQANMSIYGDLRENVNLFYPILPFFGINNHYEYFKAIIDMIFKKKE